MNAPVLSIQVCNGLVIADPCTKLLKQLEWIWELYDGVAIPQDSQIGLFEILLCNTLNARLCTSTDIGLVWKDRLNRLATEQVLSQISSTASLTDESVPWKELELLFKHFCRIHGINATRATKILHKKRPDLIPIFDENLKRFYWTYQSLSSTYPLLSKYAPTAKLLISNVRFFRECLLGSLNDINLICGYVDAYGFPVSPVRALESLLWLDVRDNSRNYRATPPP